MSYLVLARKYRPQAFDEVIGQEHITDILIKALESSRLAHAYLFCGPRGIGKTSCARILAKSLNCAGGPTTAPCGACSACLEIAKGTSFDVLEIDGASSRGIDEIRTLRENVKFAPACGRYKIYIIDEVHMLTSEAFNALLKTLEEPPAHVKFILATTAPNKIPATIISRCQRFDFKRIAIKTIVGMLEVVSKKENLKADQEALFGIAKAAQGSLRDALSILDQLGSLSEKGISAENVCSMLGLVETQLLFDLADAVGCRDCAKAFEVLEQIIDKGKDVKQLCVDITEHFRHLMIIKAGGKALGRLVDYPVAVKEVFLVQSRQFTLEEILTVIDTLIEAQEMARITESVRMSLEVALARLTYHPQQGTGMSLEEVRPVQKRSAVQTASGILQNKNGFVVISGRGALSGENPQEPEISPETIGMREDVSGFIDLPVADGPEPLTEAPLAKVDLQRVKHAWDALTHAVSREKMSAATYLQEGSPYAMDDNTLTIGFPPKCQFQKDALEDKSNADLVRKIFSDNLKTSIGVKYEIVENCLPQEEVQNVKDALDAFHGKVVSRWHDES